MLGAYGVLVEDEPGAEPPDKKSLRLLKECQGFLAICTNDLKDEKGVYSPKSNVTIEIKEWQNDHRTERMVIIKERGCALPVLLGNPTYSAEFSGVEILECTTRALTEFQAMGLIPYKISEKKKIQIELTKKEQKLLMLLASHTNKTAQRESLESIKRDCGFSLQEWNVAMHRLRGSETGAGLVYYSEASQWDNERVTLVEKGMQYLIESKLINPS